MGRGVEALRPVGRPIATNRRPGRRCGPVVNCRPVVGLSLGAARSSPVASLNGLLVNLNGPQASRSGPLVNRRARLSRSVQLNLSRSGPLSLNLSGRGSRRRWAINRNDPVDRSRLTVCRPTICRRTVRVQR